MENKKEINLELSHQDLKQIVGACQYPNDGGPRMPDYDINSKEHLERTGKMVKQLAPTFMRALSEF
jgi:hypothetical protein